MYFIDLEAINSHLREYFAIMNISETPLVSSLLGKQNQMPSYPDDPKRRNLLNTRIYYEIMDHRNESQINIIKRLSQKS